MNDKWIVLNEDSNIVWRGGEEPTEQFLLLLSKAAPGATYTAYYADFTINVTITPR